MKFSNSTLVLVGVGLTAFGSPAAAENHRVLVVDVVTKQADPNSQILLVEIESAKVLARTEVGTGLEVGLSQKGDCLAVLSYNLVGGIAQSHPRLAVYRTSDLKLLKRGLLPFVHSGGFQRFPPFPTIAFSPDGQEIVHQRMRSFQSDDKPIRWPVYSTIFSFVMSELDEDGKFKSARPDMEIPRCRPAGYLSVSKWPRLSFWNPSMAVVQVVDVRNRTILSRLPLDYEDDPVLKTLDPTYLEKPTIGQVNRHLGANGIVISGGGRYAYYVPRPTRNPKAEPGFLKKIDLSADPPKMIQQGKERQPGLWAPGAVATDAGGAIVVPVEKRVSEHSGKPSDRLRVYGTPGLNLINEIKVSLTSCDYLEPSVDGKYIYALSRDQAKIAVIDLATGREVKVLGIGKYPALILALPEPGADK